MTSSMDFTMGSSANIETKLSKSLDDIIKTGAGSNKPKGPGGPKKKVVPVKGKAKILTVPRNQTQGRKQPATGARGAPANRGKGNIQSRLQKAGTRPTAQGVRANGRIQAQQHASQAARESALAKKRGIQPTIKTRLTPANPITAGRTSIANRMRPVQPRLKQATPLLRGAQAAAPARQNAETTKFKITIQNDLKGNPRPRPNQQPVNMPGGATASGMKQTMLRGTNGGARQSGPANGRGSALPGAGKSLSDRFGLLSKTSKGQTGLRRGGPQGKQLTTNAAGVVMPF